MDSVGAEAVVMSQSRKVWDRNTEQDGPANLEEKIARFFQNTFKLQMLGPLATLVPEVSIARGVIPVVNEYFNFIAVKICGRIGITTQELCSSSYYKSIKKSVIHHCETVYQTKDLKDFKHAVDSVNKPYRFHETCFVQICICAFTLNYVPEVPKEFIRGYVASVIHFFGSPEQLPEGRIGMAFASLCGCTVPIEVDFQNTVKAVKDALGPEALTFVDAVADLYFMWTLMHEVTSLKAFAGLMYFFHGRAYRYANKNAKQAGLLMLALFVIWKILKRVPQDSEAKTDQESKVQVLPQDFAFDEEEREMLKDVAPNEYAFVQVCESRFQQYAPKITQFSFSLHHANTLLNFAKLVLGITTFCYLIRKDLGLSMNVKNGFYAKAVQMNEEFAKLTIEARLEFSHDLQTRMSELVTKYRGCKALGTTFERNTVQEMAILTSNLATLTNLKLQAKTQPVPFGIKIVGESGVGKSVLSRQLAVAAYTRLTTKIPTETDMYNFHYDQNYKYLDGYTGQPIWVCQDPDVKPDSNFSSIIKQFLSEDRQPVNKASVEDKGKYLTYIRVFAITSNADHFGDDTRLSHEDKHAINRRFHLNIKVSRREGEPVNRADWSHLSIQTFADDSGTGAYGHTNMTLQQLLDQAIDRYNRRSIPPDVFNANPFLQIGAPRVHADSDDESTIEISSTPAQSSYRRTRISAEDLESGVLSERNGHFPEGLVHRLTQPVVTTPLRSDYNKKLGEWEPMWVRQTGNTDEDDDYIEAMNDTWRSELAINPQLKEYTVRQFLDTLEERRCRVLFPFFANPLESFCDTLLKVPNLVKKIYKAIAYVGVTILVANALLNFATKTQCANSGRIRNTTSQSQRELSAQKIVPLSICPVQVGEATTAQDIIAQVRQNLGIVSFTCEVDNRITYVTQHVLYLRRGVVLMNYHSMLQAIENKCSLATFVFNDLRIEIKFNDFFVKSMCKIYESRDIILIKNGAFAMAGLSTHLFEQESKVNLCAKDIEFYVVTPTQVFVVNGSHNQNPAEHYHVVSRGEKHCFRINGIIYDRFQHESDGVGLCGIPLINAQTGMIQAVHCSRKDAMTSSAQYVTREIIAGCDNPDNWTTVTCEAFPSIAESVKKLPGAVVDKSASVRYVPPSIQSRKVLSGFEGIPSFVTEKKQPAVPGWFIDATGKLNNSLYRTFVIMCQANITSPVPPDFSLLEEAKTLFRKDVSHFTVFKPEYDELLIGSDRMNPLNPSSSIGSNARNFTGTKKQVFPNEKNYNSLRADFMNFMKSEQISSRDLVFRACFKDECLPIRTGPQGPMIKSARTFFSSPVLLSLLFRYFFGWLSTGLKKEPVKSGFGVGISTTHWRELYQKVGDEPISGDMPNWDISIHREIELAIYWAVLPLMEPVFTPTEMDRVRTLLNLIKVARVQVEDTVFLFDHGLLSGSDGTTLRGGFAHKFHLSWAMSEALNKPFADSWNYIRDNYVTYSDDGIGKLPEDPEFYEVMKKHGLAMTNTEKSGPPQKLPISSSTFLSRGFRFANDAIYNPLPMNTLGQTGVYKWVDIDRKSMLDSLYPQMCTELAIQSDEVYTKAMEEFMKNLEKVNYYPTIYPRQYWLENPQYLEQYPESELVTGAAGIANLLEEGEASKILEKTTGVLRLGSGIHSVASEIKSLFGLANPNPTRPNDHLGNTFKYANANGTHDHPKLTLDKMNQVDHSEIDVMNSFAKLAEVECFVGKFTWNASAVAGDILLDSLPISPMLTWRNFSSGGGIDDYNEFTLTPAGHGASMFTWWRGIPVIKLTFVKSMLTTGQVAVVFGSGGYTNVDFTTGDNNPVATSLFTTDLSEKSEETYAFPWGDAVAYKQCMLHFFDETYQSDPELFFASTVGSLKVQVLQPLLSNTCTSNNVEVFVSLSWKHFQVAGRTPKHLSIYERTEPALAVDAQHAESSITGVVPMDFTNEGSTEDQFIDPFRSDDFQDDPEQMDNKLTDAGHDNQHIEEDDGQVNDEVGAGNVVANILPIGTQQVSTPRVERHFLLGKDTWTTAGIVATFDIPQDVYKKPPMRVQLDYSMWSRSNYEVTVKITSAPTMQGMLMVFAVPLPELQGTSYMGALEGNMMLWKQFPHFKMLASSDKTQSMVLPFMGVNAGYPHVSTYAFYQSQFGYRLFILGATDVLGTDGCTNSIVVQTYVAPKDMVVLTPVPQTYQEPESGMSSVPPQFQNKLISTKTVKGKSTESSINPDVSSAVSKLKISPDSNRPSQSRRRAQYQNKSAPQQGRFNIQKPLMTQAVAVGLRPVDKFVIGETVGSFKNVLSSTHMFVTNTQISSTSGSLNNIFYALHVTSVPFNFTDPSEHGLRMFTWARDCFSLHRGSLVVRQSLPGRASVVSTASIPSHDYSFMSVAYNVSDTVPGVVFLSSMVNPLISPVYPYSELLTQAAQTAMVGVNPKMVNKIDGETGYYCTAPQTFIRQSSSNGKHAVNVPSLMIYNGFSAVITGATPATYSWIVPGLPTFVSVGDNYSMRSFRPIPQLYVINGVLDAYRDEIVRTIYTG